MAEELDEFGIPIKRKIAQKNVETDEFGIPIKKKISTTQSTSPSVTSSTGGFNVSNPFGGQTQEEFIGKENAKEIKRQSALPSSSLEKQASNFGLTNPKKQNNLGGYRSDNVFEANAPLPSQIARQRELEEMGARGLQNYTPEQQVKLLGENLYREDNGQITQGYDENDLEGNRATYLYNKILTGLGRVASGVGDAGMQLLTTAQPRGGMPRDRFEQATSMTQEQEAFAESQLKDYRENTAPTIREYLKNTIGAKTDKRLENKYNDETFTSAIGGLAESAPAIAATIANPVAGTAAMGAQMFDGALESINSTPEGRSLDESSKTLFAGGVAAVQTLLEKYALDKILKSQSGIISDLVTRQALRQAIRETNGNVTGDVFSRLLNKEVLNLSNKFAIGGARALDGALVEYTTEAAQEGTSIAGELLTNKATGKSVFNTKNLDSWDGFTENLKRINKSGIAGLIAGGVLGGISSLAKLDANKLQQTQQMISQIDANLANENIAEETKNLLVAQKIKLQEEVDAATKKIDDTYNNLSEPQRERVNELVEQQINLQTAINDSSITEELRNTFIEQSEAINEDIANVTESVVESDEEAYNREKERISKITDLEKRKSEEIKLIMSNLASGLGEASANKINDYAERILNGTETREQVIQGLPKSFVDGIDSILEVRSEEQVVNNQPTQEQKTEVKKSTDVSVGDSIELVDGKRGTVTSIDGDSIIMELSNGTTFKANPKMVEIFKTTLEQLAPNEETVSAQEIPVVEETAQDVVRNPKLTIEIDNKEYVSDGNSVIDFNGNMLPLAEGSIAEQVLEKYNQENAKNNEAPNEVLAKAETDLEALKQVNDKNKKYDASIKRLTEAKNKGLITEKEFNEQKKRFDDVLRESLPKSSNITKEEATALNSALEEDGLTIEDIIEYESTEQQARLNQEVVQQPKPDITTDNGKADTDKGKQTEKTEEKLKAISDKRKAIKDKIANKLKSQRGNLSTGFDPSLIKDFIELGATYIEEGVARSTELIKRFREDYRDMGFDDSEITDKQISESIFSKPQETTEVSGIKKALVSDELIASVNIDKISDKQMQDLGKKLVESGEINPKEIVDEIAGVTKKFIGNETREGGIKRALQPKEVVALIYYKTTLDNQRRELLKESNRLQEEGKSTASVDAKLARLMDDITAYDVMSVITAQQQSLAFRLRKGLLDKDYNLVTQIEQYKKVNGGEIPSDVLAKFKALDKELREVKEKLAEAEKRAFEASELQAVENIVEDVIRSKPNGEKLRKAQAELKDAKASFSAFLKKNRSQLNSGLDVVGFAKEAGKVIKAYAKVGIIKLEDVISELKKEYGDELIENNLSAFEQAYNEATDTPKPFITKDGELVIPSSYIRSLVEQGVTDIDELSKAVQKEVEADLPDITIREVRDAITKYGRTVNQTSDEITQSINEAKRLGRLYSELEDLANQKKKAKTIKKANEISDRERELRRQARILENRLPKTNEELQLAEEKRISNAINATERAIRDTQERIENGELEREINNVPETTELKDARDRLKEQQAKLLELQKEAGVIERRRTENRKKQLEKFIAEKRQRLADKNFAPRAKPDPIIEDAELRSLQEEANRIRNEYDEAHYENEQANRPLSEKVYDSTIAWGTGIQRALQAGLDASAFLVQGVMAISSQTPAKTLEAIKESYQFLKSEKYEKEFFNKLKTASDFNEMKESGLALNYPNSKLGSRDYQLQGSEISKIWNFITLPLKYTIGDSFYERVKLFNPYRATERSFTGAIDTLRVQMFREFTNLLKMDGITFESDPEKYKIAANAVNNMTFRGRLRVLEPIAKELSVIFFAPRKISATLALTNPYYWGDLAASNPIVAKRAMLKMASFIGLATSITLAYLAFQDDDEENKDVFNPLSPDFMKLKIGNTRMDFFGGLNQNVILFSRMFRSQYKTSTSSKVSKLGESSFVPTRAQLGARFLTNKFAPTSALLYRWADQGAGRQIEWDDELIKGVSPIWAQNISELYNEHPAEMATFLTAMAFFGQNMSTYGGAKFLERGKDDRIIDLVQSKGGSFSKKTKSSIEVIDENTVEKRGITKTEFEKYEKTYGDYVKGELKSRYSELKDMNTEQFEKELKKIKSNATTSAKDAITGFDEDIIKITNDGETIKLTPEQLKERIKLNNRFLDRNTSSLSKYERYFIRKDKVSKDVAERKANKKLNSLANAYSKRIMLKDVLENKNKK